MQATKVFFAKSETLLKSMVDATHNLTKTTEDYSTKLKDIQEALSDYNQSIAKSSFAQLQTADIMMPIADAFQQWYSFQDAQTSACLTSFLLLLLLLLVLSVGVLCCVLSFFLSSFLAV